MDYLDEVYYKDILDRTTNTLAIPIPDILDHLFTNYGEVEATTLIQERDRVETMKSNVQSQLTVLCTAIIDLAELGRAAQNPFTPEQQVELVLKIIQSTGDYQQALLEWYQ